MSCLLYLLFDSKLGFRQILDSVYGKLPPNGRAQSHVIHFLKFWFPIRIFGISEARKFKFLVLIHNDEY